MLKNCSLLIGFFKLSLLRLRWFVLVSPMLIAGDLNADPAVIPCLAKGISACRYVDLALAYSLGAGLAPDATCTLSREDGTGSRRDFFVGCPGALAASQACYVTDLVVHSSLFSTCSLSYWCLDG